MHLRFYYDTVCPYAYLASRRVEAMAERTGATLEWCPVLGGLYRNHGTADVPGPDLRPGQGGDRSSGPHPRGRLHGHAAGAQSATSSAERHRDATAHSGRRSWRAWRSPTRSTALVVDNLDINAPEVLEPAFAHGIGLDVAHDCGPGDAPERTPSTPLTSVSLAFRPSRLTARSGGAIHCIWSSRPWVEACAYLPIGQAEPGTVIDFYHDFSSPYSYLGATQIARAAEGIGATVRFKPILLGALFNAIGTANVPIFTFGEARRAPCAAGICRTGPRTGRSPSTSRHTFRCVP